MKNIFNIYIFLILITASFIGTSQESITDENKIQLIARVQSKRIALRWAPTNPSLWMKANKYGYLIERYTIYKNGQRLESPEKVTLTSSPLLPEALENWEEKANNNDYSAIFAQALYGESFIVEEMQEGLAQIINKAKEVEQRFSFALFAADMNYETALAGGLAYVDESVKENETYYYRIATAIPEELLKATEGSVLVDAGKIEELPQPIDLIAISDDKSILLTWEYEMFKSVFTSYFIERSEDGNNFKRLGDTPLVNLNTNPEDPINRMTYIDTLSQNNKTYHYRVIGISPFGEESPSSDIASAQGTKKLSTTAHISRHDFDSAGNVILSWEFLEQEESEITGFELNWAANEKGPYKVVKTNIPSTVRKTTFQDPGASNYFTISALGKNNQKTTSFSAFVQTIDSIPPATPIGLIGIIDSLGVVKLKWDINTEKDILGYRVFRGNVKNEEVSQLTISPIEENIFTDTVQVKSLNSKVFYQIVAVDQRFNMSDYSEKIALKKPDVVPPSSPIFSEYKIDNGTVSLKWINSTSDDLKLHKLFRKTIDNEDNEWKLVFETDTISSFIDEKVMANSRYRYAIFAEDESGLLSEPSTPLTITAKNFKPQQSLKGVNAFADLTKMNIQISWKKPSNDIIEVLIYKSKGEDKPILWKQIPATINSLTDTKVALDNLYTYHFKPVLTQGGFADIKTVEVKF